MGKEPSQSLMFSGVDWGSCGYKYTHLCSNALNLRQRRDFGMGSCRLGTRDENLASDAIDIVSQNHSRRQG